MFLMSTAAQKLRRLQINLLQFEIMLSVFDTMVIDTIFFLPAFFSKQGIEQKNFIILITITLYHHQQNNRCFFLCCQLLVRKLSIDAKELFHIVLINKFFCFIFLLPKSLHISPAVSYQCTAHHAHLGRYKVAIPENRNFMNHYFCPFYYATEKLIKVEEIHEL